MLAPKVFENDLFDDWFDPFGMMKEMTSLDRKLYGKHANREMLMDVKENGDHYEVEIDLPGFHKEDINIEINDGYMTVSANKGINEDDKDKKGKIIRQERYAGSMQRSFYVGDAVKQEDVKAKFEDGVLKLSIPKNETEKLPEKQYIAIEG
jgi:HSP20 family molecular chaperone IbpA